MNGLPRKTVSPPRPRHRGFMAVDVTLAIAMALLLLMSMTVLVVKRRAAENRMAMVRAGARNAETMLLNLQTAGPVPDGAKVDKLPDSAPPGYAWVRLTVPPKDGAPDASLVGLVSAGVLEKGGQP